MDIPKASFIIPVYNSEMYLEKCICSVLNQNFSDFEVILINDGSNDSSGKICDDYGQKDTRIKVYHQENKGVSFARNVGIKHAIGEWCCFIDSDDWIEPDYLSAFFSSNPKKNNLIIQEVKKYFEGNYKITEYYQYKTYFINNFSNLLKDNLILFNGFPFAKFYHLNVIKENSLSFNKDIKFGEDLIFFLDYLKHIDSITFIKEALYIYVYNSKSVSYNLHLFEDYEKSTDGYKKSLSSLFEIDNWEDIEQIKNSFSVFFTLKLFSIYNQKSPQSKRISRLKLMNKTNDIKILASTTSNINVIRKFIFFILNHKKYSLADFILKIYVPIEFNFMMPIKRKIKNIIEKS